MKNQKLRTWYMSRPNDFVSPRFGFVFLTHNGSPAGPGPSPLFFLGSLFIFCHLPWFFIISEGGKAAERGKCLENHVELELELSLSWSQPKMCHTLVVGFWQMLRVPKGFLFSFIFGWWLMEVGLERGRIIYSFIIKIISIKVFNIYFYYKNNYYKYIY